MNDVFNTMIDAKKLERFFVTVTPSGMRVFINPDHVMRMVEE
jgi:hypothetical protein